MGPPLVSQAKPYEFLPLVLISRGIVNCGEHAWAIRGVCWRRTSARYVSVATAKMGGAIHHKIPLNQGNEKKVLHKLHSSRESEYSYNDLLSKLTHTSNSKLLN